MFVETGPWAGFPSEVTLSTAWPGECRDCEARRSQDYLPGASSTWGAGLAIPGNTLSSPGRLPGIQVRVSAALLSERALVCENVAEAEEVLMGRR